MIIENEKKGQPKLMLCPKCQQHTKTTWQVTCNFCHSASEIKQLRRWVSNEIVNIRKNIDALENKPIANMQNKITDADGNTWNIKVSTDYSNIKSLCDSCGHINTLEQCVAKRNFVTKNMIIIKCDTYEVWPPKK